MIAEEDFAFPIKVPSVEDSPGLTALAYFAAHAPFTLNDIASPRNPGSFHGFGIPLDVNARIDDINERMEALATLRVIYAAKLVEALNKFEEELNGR